VAVSNQRVHIKKVNNITILPYHHFKKQIFDNGDTIIGESQYNMDMMSGMFPGVTGELLSNAAKKPGQDLRRYCRIKGSPEFSGVR
jgi:hypothetical protein